MRGVRQTLLAGALASTFATHPSRASDDENVILRAGDAFGERVGIEQVGLYNETQVRGFNIGNTGAYRINGAYFVRAGGQPLPDVLLDGVTVRVGISAARLDYPSPSGVVDYRLRTPRGNQVTVTAGIREYATPFVQTDFSRSTSDGRLGVAGGMLVSARDYSDGTGGSLLSVGVIPQWNASDAITVQIVASGERSRFNGYYALSVPADAAALPAPLQTGVDYGAPWADYLRKTYNAGVIARIQLSEKISAHATAMYADNTVAPADFTTVTLNPDGTALATFVRNTRQHESDASTEAMLRYSFAMLGGQHSLAAAVRNRRTRVLTVAAPTFVTTLPDIARHAYPPEPSLHASDSGRHDDVDLLVGSISYAGLFFDHVEVRGGLHRGTYEKRVMTPSSKLNALVQSDWSYNISVLATLSGTVSAFANTVRGVEESGTAPGNAVNHDEILPAVTAEEYEIGVRCAMADRLFASLAAFDTKKRTPGFLPDGVYALVGEVTHRGIEASVTGTLTPGTTVVLGLVAMHPRVAGRAVADGLVGPRPVGISPTIAVASVDHALEGAPNWSVDARLTWVSAVPANSLDTLHTPGTLSLDIGTRYRFSIWGAPAVFRGVISNLDTRNGWVANASSQLKRTPAVAGRATISVTL